jgi:hypothetical protein
MVSTVRIGCDCWNHCIRKIILTTFEVQSFVGTCGQGGQHGFVDGMELVLMHNLIVLDLQTEQRSPSHLITNLLFSLT